MDSESRHSSHDPRSADDADADSSSVHRSGQPDSQCIICRRAFSSETEAAEGFEALCICRECKITVLNGNETSVTLADTHRRRRHRGRSRYQSSESIEDLFSQQFSQLISLVRQNQEAQVDGDDAIAVQRGVRRLQRTFSDNESDGLYQTDSLFGESDSNISFGAYGESDASLDGHSLLDREMLVQLDNESHVYTDTDIDPMRAGLDQWNSDDEDEDWDEADVDEPVGSVERHQQIRGVNQSPVGSIERAALGRAWIRWRMGGGRNVHYADIYTTLEESEITPPPYVGNPGDYVDAIGFEELMDQLAEIGSSSRGPPPAAASIVVKLPHVVISEDHEKNGSLVCAVCKDPLHINTEAKQLPCMHLYHPSCILPWLNVRNTCPVCRYELPLDDLEYEEVKSNMNITESHAIGGRQQQQQRESSSDLSSDIEADEEVRESSDGGAAQGAGDEGVDPVSPSLSREGGARRWILLAAAAPIVGFVGMALVFLFRNPTDGRRIQWSGREQNHQQLQRPRGTSATAERNRRWWSLI